MRSPGLPYVACEIMTGLPPQPTMEYVRDGETDCPYIAANTGEIFFIKVSGPTAFDKDDGENYFPVISVKVDGIQLNTVWKDQPEVMLPPPEGLTIGDTRTTKVTGLFFKSLTMVPLSSSIEDIGTIEVVIYATKHKSTSKSSRRKWRRCNRIEDNADVEDAPDQPFKYEDFKKDFRTHRVELATTSVPADHRQPEHALGERLASYTFKYRSTSILEAFGVKDEVGVKLGGPPIVRDNYPTIKEEDGRKVIHIVDDD